MDSTSRDKRAAIVCSHVALENKGILRAVRDEPTESEDSGWQFTCAETKHDDSDNAQVWLIHEVLERDPSLEAFIHYPPGTVLVRKYINSTWVLVEAKKG